MESLAIAVMWIRSAWGAEDEFGKVVGSFPGYDREVQRREEEVRQRALKKMKKKKSA
jgi:hypothetical protein